MQTKILFKQAPLSKPFTSLELYFFQFVLVVYMFSTKFYPLASLELTANVRERPERNSLIFTLLTKSNPKTYPKEMFIYSKDKQ